MSPKKTPKEKLLERKDRALSERGAFLEKTHGKTRERTRVIPDKKKKQERERCRRPIDPDPTR